MTNIADDLYLGNFTGQQGLSLLPTSQENPTAQIGVGPMGRIAFLNIVPLTLSTTNVAASQSTTSITSLALTAGTGTTAGTAPDGSGAAVVVLDVPRAVSISSASDYSGVTVTVVGYDQYGKKLTNTITGPGVGATVNTLKAYKSVLSITLSATVAHSVSAGTADIFGLPYAITDAGYIVSAKWNNALAQDAGTFVAAVTTVPSTAALGDVRGTYKPSTGASDGAKRLVIGMHLTAAQCGSAPTITALLGQPQV